MGGSGGPEDLAGPSARSDGRTVSLRRGLVVRGKPAPDLARAARPRGPPAGGDAGGRAGFSPRPRRVGGGAGLEGPRAPLRLEPIRPVGAARRGDRRVPRGSGAGRVARRLV